MFSRIHKFIHKFKFTIIVAYIFNNYIQYVKLLFFPKKTSNSGRSTNKLNAKKEYDKSQVEFKLYSKFISDDEMKNSSILEIGTGAFFLSGFSFIANGCKSFKTIDKFYCLRNADDQVKVLKEFSKHISKEKKNILYDKIAFDGEKFSMDSSALNFEQTSLEDFESKSKFDFIVSYAVFEHIWNLNDSIKKIKTLLNDDGRFLALVCDYDHGMFTPNFSNYEFYKISSSTYSHMVALSGRPNRILLSDYKSQFESAGFEVNSFIVRDMNDKEYVPPIPYEEFKVPLNDLRKLKKEISQFDSSFDKHAYVDFFAKFFIIEAKLKKGR